MTHNEVGPLDWQLKYLYLDQEYHPKLIFVFNFNTTNMYCDFLHIAKQEIPYMQILFTFLLRLSNLFMNS